MKVQKALGASAEWGNITYSECNNGVMVDYILSESVRRSYYRSIDNIFNDGPHVSPLDTRLKGVLEQRVYANE